MCVQFLLWIVTTSKQSDRKAFNKVGELAGVSSTTDCMRNTWEPTLFLTAQEKNVNSTTWRNSFTSLHIKFTWTGMDEPSVDFSLSDSLFPFELACFTSCCELLCFVRLPWTRPAPWKRAIWLLEQFANVSVVAFVRSPNQCILLKQRKRNCFSPVTRFCCSVSVFFLNKVQPLYGVFLYELYRAQSCFRWTSLPSIVFHCFLKQSLALNGEWWIAKQFRPKQTWQSNMSQLVLSSSHSGR